MSRKNAKPVVIITGASGNIGKALCSVLKDQCNIVGLDILPCPKTAKFYECDLTSADSIKLQLSKIRDEFGSKIAAVFHLAAYFDFSGEDHPLYKKLNVEGTKNLLEELQSFAVERFIYSSTMLVQAPGVPGKKINENGKVKPGWIYPQSKAEAEKTIQEHHGKIPYTILRLAGFYSEKSAVPTLSRQIARIYERDFKSHLYSGELSAGQAFLHQADMMDLFTRVLDRRKDLPKRDIMLAGEDEVMGYQELQNRIGGLIYGTKEWETIVLPEFIAKQGAWLEERAEPIIPDAIDQGEKPFIKPFMIDLASDHYDLDISRAKKALDWKPRHKIYEGLSDLVVNLKRDPEQWYEANGIVKPDWMQTAEEKEVNPDAIRENHEKEYKRQHYSFIWAHLLNTGLAFWLFSAPFILGYESQAMVWSNMISGALLFVLSLLSLSWRGGLARWGAGAVGFWLLGAPLIFWTPTAEAYLNDTLVGMLVIGFAVCSRPMPGVSGVAAQTGPEIPPDWDFNPSSWLQRMPIIILAFVGFFISRYLCAYQLGHIDAVWEPFFAGAANNPKNGTEEIITSSVSEAWPVPDAGLGGMVYALEILTGMMGSVRRWRTMPWLVMLFGFMIVPLGAVSIFFIIIQPIMIGTWCTLCLIGAAAMLIQIPYSLDELVATSEFLYRRKKQGRPLLRIFFTGDTDEGERKEAGEEFAHGPIAVIKDMLSGGVSIPWSLALCMLIGVWLMFTRLTLGHEAGMANADHLIGALVVTVVVTALAETGRILRLLLIPLGVALLVTPFLYGVGIISIAASLICGVSLMVLSVRRGRILNSYGLWDGAIR